MHLIKHLQSPNVECLSCSSRRLSATQLILVHLYPITSAVDIH